MKITKSKVYNNSLFLTLILLSFSMPESFNIINIPWIIRFTWGWLEYIAAIIILGLELISIRSKKNIIKDIPDIILYYLTKIISTVIMGVILVGTVEYAEIGSLFKKLMIICFIANALKFSYRKFVKNAFLVFAILTISNAITMFVFPHGMYTDTNYLNYLLGYKNGLAIILMPTVCLSLMYIHLFHKKLFPLITIAFAFLSILKSSSGTAIGGLAVFVIVYILIRFPVIGKKIINWKTAVVMVLVVLIVININHTPLTFLQSVSLFLNRDITYTGRSYLWDAAIRTFLKYPLLGVGDNSSVLLGIFTVFTQRIMYAHNELLDVAVRTGIIGLVLYIWMIYKTIKSVKDSNELNQIFIPIMSSMWIMMMFESYSNYIFYFAYFIVLLLPREYRNSYGNTFEKKSRL